MLIFAIITMPVFTLLAFFCGVKMAEGREYNRLVRLKSECDDLRDEIYYLKEALGIYENDMNANNPYSKGTHVIEEEPV